jgi:hypothetical protein
MPIKVRDSRESWERLLRFYLTPKRPPRRPRRGLPMPVEPNRPTLLSGGAAAPLEFDE